jgi:hypothetical protein
MKIRWRDENVKFKLERTMAGGLCVLCDAKSDILNHHISAEKNCKKKAL